MAKSKADSTKARNAAQWLELDRIACAQNDPSCHCFESVGGKVAASRATPIHAFGMRSLTFVIGLLAVGCEPPGTRSPHIEPPSARSESWAPSLRTRQDIRAECHSSVSDQYAKALGERKQAEDHLAAAELRLETAREMGHPPTVLQAMRDRDDAAQDVRLTGMSPKEAKRRYARCKHRLSSEDTKARIRALQEEEKQKETDAAEEERESARRRAIFFQALGQGMQDFGRALPGGRQGKEKPVDGCTQCLRQWCSFQCNGIGAQCQPCMKQWCDFQC